MQVFNLVTKEINRILWVQKLANLRQICNIHEKFSQQKFIL